MSRSINDSFVSNDNRLVLDLFSRDGIRPNAVQVLDPDLYSRNNDYEDSLEGGSKCIPTGYPPDPIYPSYPRMDPSAFHPIYRGGQNGVYDVLDQHTFHGVNFNNTDGTYYDWDGTPFPIFMSSALTPTEQSDYRKAWFNFVFPGFDTGNFVMRGLKQLYETTMPFLNESAPTVREFEIWNDKVLNHFRVISGLESAIPLQEHFIQIQFSNERKRTTIWNSYGGLSDSAYGPCPLPTSLSTNLHCGETFVPTLHTEQAPYWNSYYTGYPCVEMPPYIGPFTGTGAITVWYNGNAMTALSRNLRKLYDGSARLGNPIGGHGGPYAFRKYYGLTIGRSKWSGPLQSPPPGFTY